MGPAPRSSVDLGGDRYKLSSRRTFDRWGAGYDHNLIVRLFAWQWDRAVIQRLSPLGPGTCVLDLGCATGRLLARLARIPGIELAGADLSQRSLAVARGKLAEIGIEADLRSCDIEQPLPWPGACFDAVVLSGVLHHLPRPEAALRGALRVLKPGGRFVVSDPYFFTPVRQLINAVLRIGPVHGDCRFHHPAGVVRLLEEAGFSASSLRRISWHSFLASGVRPAAPQMG